MQKPDAIEIKLRASAEGITRHALREGAPETFCGVDRTILTDTAPQVSRAHNCRVCMSAAQRYRGYDRYLRKVVA